MSWGLRFTNNRRTHQFYTANKITSAVCHGPAVFANVKVHGEPLVKGKKFTGFSNTEEEA
jgi:putative intracellular protease/amidase